MTALEKLANAKFEIHELKGKLVETLGGDIVELAFVIELPDLKGREKIKDYKIFVLTEFEGE